MVAVVPIVNTILKSIRWLIDAANENRRIQGKIVGSLRTLSSEVSLARWNMANYDGADENLTLQMQELLCDIEDYIQDLSIPEKRAAFLRLAAGTDSRTEDIELIDSFVTNIKRIGDLQKPISTEGNATILSPAASTSSFAPEDDLDEGFLNTKDDFLQLLSLSPPHGRHLSLRVISIVGGSGLGKTALARAVYEATHIQLSPSTTEIDGGAPVLPSPATTEIHELTTANGATPVQSSPPSTESLEPVAINEDSHVHLSPATIEIHQLLKNGATPVQTSSPTIEVIQPVAATRITHVPPFPPTTQIHETITASEATPVQPSPPTTEIHEPIAFSCKAWVDASTCTDTKVLLNKVLDALGRTSDGENDTKMSIKEFLLDKRYLIIIDDLGSCDVKWRNIEHAFPENCKGSRIIVTTSVQSIARDYSSGSYYVYPMECLGRANSEGLFWKKFFGPLPHRPLSAAERTLSTSILAICGGLPLAVISAGNYLCWKDRNPYLSDDRYRQVCEELHNIVASEEITFDGMKRMFAQCYKDLADYDHKNCLLYFSIFPRGYQINSKSFVRKLKGEALVAGDVVKCLKDLLDKSLIEPSLTLNSCNVAKRCQVQSMMLEFTIHKSVSRNLVTLVDKGIVRQNKPDGHIQWQKKVRRLTVQSGSSNNEGRSSSSAFGGTGSSSEEESSSSSRNDLIPDGIELSAVRSLTILKSELLHPPQNIKGQAGNIPPNSRVKFESCKMMRVLDLEGCEGLNTVIGDICEMLFLKYLSLRNTDLEELPTSIEKLKRLGMLDIRQSRVEILPVAVVMLPELSHLFGEFEIPQLAGREAEDVTKFLKEKSKLHTLAGVVIKETRGFEIVIRNARNLKKVKLYGDRHTAPARASKPTSWIPKIFSKREDKHSAPAASAPSPEHKIMAAVLVSSLRKRFLDLDSISIESDCISRDFLSSTHKASSVVSSLKLRGPLTSISGSTLEKLHNLSKLHLLSTGLRSKDLVRALQNLTNLQYLKLSEEDGSKGWEGEFSVENGKFSALLELCFEGTVKYPRMKIAEGAMGVLKSLQLLCPHPVMEVEGIEHLKFLDEVILHDTADLPTVKAWKEAAKNHTNMPCVKKVTAQPISNAA